jgi:excisionase family DNA binding protein
MRHHKKTIPTITPLFFTLKEAAQYLAISTSLLYPLIREGIIPSVRFGENRAIRIPRALLTETVLANVGKHLVVKRAPKAEKANSLAPVVASDYPGEERGSGEAGNAATEAVSPDAYEEAVDDCAGEVASADEAEADTEEPADTSAQYEGEEA